MKAPFDIFPSEDGFLGLPAEEAVDYATAKAVIIPYGLEGSVSYGGGTAMGPAAMIEASNEILYICLPERTHTRPFKCGLARSA